MSFMSSHEIRDTVVPPCLKPQLTFYMTEKCGLSFMAGGGGGFNTLAGGGFITLLRAGKWGDTDYQK